MPLPDPRQLTAARIQRTDAYAAKVQRMFAQTVNELAALPLTPPAVDKGEMFSFDNETARVQRQVEQLLRRLHATATMAIRAGIELEWEQANRACDTIIKSQFAAKALKSHQMRGWNARNGEAMRQFINRSECGMNLSDRIWRTCRQLRDEMEVALTISIGKGEDAGTISRRVRQYLNDPDLMFRRFRYKDADGVWQSKWKKRIKDPARPGKYRFIDCDKDSYRDQWTGPGYYKSSAKNAMRVARTETNIAYRRADHERWQGLDFVLGQQVQLSKNHPCEDICDTLAGDYPKDFVFDGWHPQCFCFVTPILLPPEEMAKMNEAFARGEQYTPNAKPVTEYPAGFRQWVKANETKIAAARKRGTEPYFIRNNARVVDGIINPKALKSSEKAKWFDTPEQADKALRDQAGEFWRSLNSDEKELFAEYTGEGYVDINRAMRGLNTSEPFAEEKGEDLKWLIDNCKMEHPVWVQRVETIDGLKRFGIVDPESASMSELKSLVGRTFENESFISTCAVKGSAEKQDIDYGILFDIKVPKGASAVYVEPFSTYGNGDGIKWDGLSKQKTIGSEAELLINAGQKLMVTGAKLKDEIWHIELKVVTKDTAKGASLKQKPLTIAERAKIRHDARTPEQEEAIRSKWQERQRQREEERIRQERINTTANNVLGVANARFKGLGIDTTALEAAIQSGDIAAINAETRALAKLMSEKQMQVKQAATTRISKNMPDVFKPGEKYTTEYGDVEFSSDFFDLLVEPPKIELKFDNSGSEEEFGGKLVRIASHTRLKNSPWFRRSLIYHECGHAIGDQRGIIDPFTCSTVETKLSKLRAEQIKRLKKKEKAIIVETIQEYDFKTGKYINVKKRYEVNQSRAKTISEKLRIVGAKIFVKPEDDPIFARLGLGKHDILEQIGAVQDTLKSLIRSVGSGHTNAYFSMEDCRQHEYLAHCFENRFAGNRVFQLYLPDIYAEMISFANSIKKP